MTKSEWVLGEGPGALSLSPEWVVGEGSGGSASIPQYWLFTSFDVVLQELKLPRY